VAEGVEGTGYLKRIKALKINKCQGYHFSKALPYEVFIEWVQAY
jgi:sensor c-di-GMP phosphodiesterase-like protein